MRNHFAPLAALCFVAFGGAGCNTMQLAKDGAAASTAIGAAAAADPRVAKFVAKVERDDRQGFDEARNRLLPKGPGNFRCRRHRKPVRERHDGERDQRRAKFPRDLL